MQSMVKMVFEHPQSANVTPNLHENIFNKTDMLQFDPTMQLRPKTKNNENRASNMILKPNEDSNIQLNNSKLDEDILFESIRRNVINENHHRSQSGPKYMVSPYIKSSRHFDKIKTNVYSMSNSNRDMKKFVLPKVIN